MAARLAQRGANHHLGFLVAPAGTSQHRVHRAQRHFIVRTHHPPCRAPLVGQVEPRAFINEPLPQHRFGIGPQGGVRAGETVDDHQPFGERRGRHIGGREPDLAEHRGFGSAVAREGAERCDAQQARVAPPAIFALEPTIEHRFHRLEHRRARLFGNDKAGFGGHGQDIGGQRLGAAQLGDRPIPQQPIAIEIGRDLARKPVPTRAVTRNDEPRGLLFETIIGVSLHIAAHAFERRRERCRQTDIDKAHASQSACRRLQRQARCLGDAHQRRRPDFNGNRRDHILRHRKRIARFAGARVDAPVEAVDAIGCGQMPGDRRRPARRNRHRQRCAGRDLWGYPHARGDRHRLVGRVAQRETRAKLITATHEWRQPREDRKILRGAHCR